MTELTKKRREELRSHLDSINWPHSDVTYGELRALLDLADERDRYRHLLERCARYLPDGTAEQRAVRDCVAAVLVLEDKNDD